METSSMEFILHQIGEYLIPAMIALCVIIAMALKAAMTVLTTASRERSRREIAAYIAEGSISAEQGERLIQARVSGQANQAT